MANYADTYYEEVDDLFNKLKPSSFDTLADPPGQQEQPLGPVGWVENADAEDGEAKVIIDSDGITVLDGKITIQDLSGQSVLTAAGFGGSWVQFLSTRFYNGLFGAGTTGVDFTVSEVGGADTEAEYADSLSDELPYWVIKSRTGSFQMVADSGAPNGKALKWSGASFDADLYQDIPVVPGNSYNIILQWRYDSPGAEAFNREIGVSYRDADHAIIGIESALGLAFTAGTTTYTHEQVHSSIPAPANAKYLRVRVRMQRTAGAPDVWMAGIEATQRLVFGGLLFQDDVDILGQLYVAGPSQVDSTFFVSLDATLASDVLVGGTLQVDEVVRIEGTGDASLSSTDHGLQIGLTTGANLIADGNEIIARNNGAANDLHLNADGGQVKINANSASTGLSVNGPIASTNISLSDINFAITLPGMIEWTERADTGAPAANQARMYTRDNGAGKTQLVIRFNTGAIQVIATQP